MGAVQITTFAPDANWRSETPDNIWWSDNSETLFYQDEISRLAWAYNIQTGIIESIPYVPRSIPELEIELSSRIPQNASLYAISPQKRHLLYTVPLTIPIPIELPITEDENSNPQFTRELWVLQNDQAYQLGLVDDCFLLHVPRWSKAENHAAVNTLFTPDIQHPCLFDVWWIDLISLKVEGLPFDQIINKSISVLDLAVDGDKVLISEAGKDGEQYIFDFETGDYFDNVRFNG